MTPTQRSAALAIFRTMLPTPEREDLRKAIQAVDERDATAARHLETGKALARAQEVHDATAARLAEQEAAAADGAAHVAALLEGHEGDAPGAS